MVLYDPIFGIRFLPEILTTVGRIHISRKKHTGESFVKLIVERFQVQGSSPCSTMVPS